MPGRRSLSPTQINLYSSYFKLHLRWLPSFTPVTYLCKLLGLHLVAAFLQLELFRVYEDMMNKKERLSALFCNLSVRAGVL
ncbi:hypothetical protein CBW52_12340 [Yersinia kristensenii]|uniref:Uncharacterized protein n=1 Tax=Yersinia kristensenii TaxID=28152 RepID=A0AB73NJH9_YERKR|nr:hypothetical protein CBW52_12340 [Yersinia kristensenii]